MLSKLSVLKLNKIAAVLIVAATLQGCVAATIAVVATSANMATDRRSIGNQIDDQNIELAAYEKIAETDEISDHVNIQITSVNGSILLVGQAPSNHLRDAVLKLMNEVTGVVQIHNQIRIGYVTSMTTRTKDVWLTSKVKTALFSSDKVSTKDIKVVTENGEVFLMGLVSQAEADEAVNVARNIGGVKRVFKAFEYL